MPLQSTWKVHFADPFAVVEYDTFVVKSAKHAALVGRSSCSKPTVPSSTAYSVKFPVLSVVLTTRVFLPEEVQALMFVTV